MNVTRLQAPAAIIAFALLCACAQQPRAEAAASPAAARSILVRSSPAAGSSVKGPVDSLELRFDPPARLGEVTVTGPDGMMPMMVTSVGEVSDYSLPLSDLGPGSYTVNWKATAAGKNYQGDFGFNVR